MMVQKSKPYQYGSFDMVLHGARLHKSEQKNKLIVTAPVTIVITAMVSVL